MVDSPAPSWSCGGPLDPHLGLVATGKDLFTGGARFAGAVMGRRALPRVSLARSSAPTDRWPGASPSALLEREGCRSGKRVDMTLAWTPPQD